MKKVLHIIVGLKIGGAESCLQRLILADKDNKNIEHEVISLTDMGVIGPTLLDNGIKVHALGLNEVTRTPIALFRLLQLIKKIRPQVVQTWMYHADLLGGIAAKIAGVPHICWGVRHTNLDKDSLKNTTFVVMKAAALISKHVPDSIISCSRKAISNHVSQGYDRSKFSLIQNGYDLSKFKPTSIKTKLFQTNKPIIAMVARFDRQKDHNNLLQALSDLKDKGVDFHLVLIGRDMDCDNQALLQYIERSSLKLGDDVTLLGQVSNLPEIYNAIDLHVLSSYSEGFPNVLAEAMACGIPCVTTDVGDASEIVEDYGWVVQPNDSFALASAIHNALDELKNKSDEWEVRKKKCVTHIENRFGLDVMTNHFHKQWKI